MSELLLLNGLTGGYGVSRVIDGVNLVLDREEIVGLIGPNGHGKSTLASLMCGAIPAWSGSILYRGREMVGLKCHRFARSGISYIPQGDLLFGDLSVQENLWMGSFPRDQWKGRSIRIAKVYELFPSLRMRERNLASTLSGGERRMLAIGRGLMAEADILIIDEPALGLSPQAVNSIYGGLSKLKYSGTTLLIIEENPGRLAGIASRGYLLDGGRLVAEGPMDELANSGDLATTYLGRAFDID